MKVDIWVQNVFLTGIHVSLINIKIINIILIIVVLFYGKYSLFYSILLETIWSILVIFLKDKILGYLFWLHVPIKKLDKLAFEGSNSFYVGMLWWFFLFCRYWKHLSGIIDILLSIYYLCIVCSRVPHFLSNVSLVIIYLHIGFGTLETSRVIYQKGIYLRNEGEITL